MTEQKKKRSKVTWEGLFYTSFSTAVILLIPICICINFLGKLLADKLRLPLWLDSTGTCISAVLGGPLVGAFCGACNNVLYGLAIGYTATLVYSLSGLCLGLVVGIMARLGFMERFGKMLLTSLAGAVVCVLTSTPLNILFFGGLSGNSWGDSLFQGLLLKGYSLPVASLLDELAVDIPDKLLTLALTFLILWLLPPKIKKLYPLHEQDTASGF